MKGTIKKSEERYSRENEGNIDWMRSLESTRVTADNRMNQKSNINKAVIIEERIGNNIFYNIL